MILTLNISVSHFCKLRSWILKEPPFARSSLWSWYTIYKALSWMRFIWLFNFGLWSIETTGAYENWEVMKALRKSFLSSNFKEYM